MVIQQKKEKNGFQQFNMSRPPKKPKKYISISIVILQNNLKKYNNEIETLNFEIMHRINALKFNNKFDHNFYENDLIVLRRLKCYKIVNKISYLLKIIEK